MTDEDRRARRAVLVAAATASFLTPFTGSSVNLALPAIGRAFALDPVLLGWVATAFLLAAAALLLPFGRLADLYGRKRVFAAGIAIFALASALCAAAPSVGVLLAARTLQGVGSAMIFGTGVAILTSVFGPGERGRALGVNVAAVYLGLTLGPPVGGLLTDRLGWRSVFVATPPVAVLVLAWLLRRVRGEWADARGERFDWLGSAVYALSLVALIGGLSRFPGPAGAALLGGAALGLAAFGAIESRHPHPVFDVQTLLRNRAFAFSNLAALLHYSATFAVGYLLSLYLQVVRGWGAQAAGTLLLVQPAVMAALSPAAGRASDRVPPRLVASAGMALTALGLGLLAASVGPATHTATLAAYLALLGLGFALFSSPNTNAVMSAVEPRAYGVASAAVGTARLTGQMLSLGLATTVLAASLGRAPLEPALHPAFLRAMRLAFALFAGLCAAGVFASLARDPAPARDPRARAARRP